MGILSISMVLKFMEFPHRKSASKIISIIYPDLVGNIKFSSGGFPARYAHKMSSVLGITYREPEAFEGAVALSLDGRFAFIGH